MALERLKHIKTYPQIRKCLVGLLIALIGVFALSITCGADTTYSETVAPYGFTQKINTEQTIDNVRCITSVDFKTNLAVFQGAKQYLLAYATMPTNKVSIGNYSAYYKGGGVYSDTRYFDILVATQTTTGETNRIYLRTYISQYGEGEDVRAFGYRVSYRLVYDGFLKTPLDFITPQEPQGKNLVGSHRFEDIGVTVNYDYTLTSYGTTDAVEAYNTGYTDAMEQIDLSGLNPTQSALGAISAPINAIANVVQSAVGGFLGNPVGGVIGLLIGIVFVVALAFVFLRKVF